MTDTNTNSKIKLLNEDGYLPHIAKSFFAWQHFKHINKNVLLCLPDEESAQIAYKQIRFFSNNNGNLLHLPALDTVPYDRVSPSAEIISKRANVFTEIASSLEPKLIVTSAINIVTLCPPAEIFSNNILLLRPGYDLNIKSIAEFLVKNGYTRSASAVDSGEFAIRGEIIDFVNHENKGIRAHFAWEKIESIKEFDPYSQISKKKLEQYSIFSASETILNEQSISKFKERFLTEFGVNHINNPLYESIISGKKFHGYENLLPLFYDNLASLFSFLGTDYSILYDNICLQSILEHEHSYNDFYESRVLSNKTNPDSFYFAVKPEKYIINSEEIKTTLENPENILLSSGYNSQLGKIKAIPNVETLAKSESKTQAQKAFEILSEDIKKTAIITCGSKAARERIKSLATEYEHTTNEIKNLKSAKKNLINIAITPLVQGFITDKYIFITEKDILGTKFNIRRNRSSKKKLQNMLTELDNIKEGELITHKEHGVGVFEKIDTLKVNDIEHDCLKILYDGGDIYYLPVENIDQIKKFGSDDANLDKLGGTNWQKRKAKLKNRIKDIAAQLMKITAKRAAVKIKPTSCEQEAYEKFCKRFPYSETSDQLSAINEVKADLEGGKLMDRLICGDVGFGKTEVALRAAFLAAFDINDHNPQIVVIAPTTILSKQHFTNFIERFKDFGLNIKQLSRLVKPAEAKRVKDGLADGSINIVIGTHALLSPSIKFHNLKMIIVDEEQHFGVSQKEHLKSLKSGVHVLTLSATPIPRTLQMSMVGIKDLSLIATPPIDRLPVRTHVMPFDAIILREALMRERFRGGLSFYVAPRIKDIEWIAKQLDNIVPELKYKIAHGQMNPAEIDTIMNEFCEGKFDILLSTTIIESGIDIPIANTMIVHKADMLGLSQLYQLRGRVGRGKVRGHAYLTLDHKKKMKKHSMQRLDLLQNIETLGAGFTIASHDMDLRGFGNLVGDEQSGHIKEVGTELYQDMLDTAIQELKEQDSSPSTKVSTDLSPTINLGLAVFIPSNYIENSSLRLAIYRRTGDLRNAEEIEIFQDEMIDRFGPLPKEFKNLLEMVKLKHHLIKLKIQQLDSGPNGFVVKFYDQFDVSEMVMSFVKKYPRHAKIKPDSKLVFLKPLTSKNILKETQALITTFLDV